MFIAMRYLLGCADGPKQPFELPIMKVLLMTKHLLALSLLLTMVVPCRGFAVGASPQQQQILSFQKWKEREILAADNRVARLNNKIVQLRQKPSDQTRQIDHLGEQLRNALAAATVVHNLTEDDYITVYLRQFAPAPGMVQKIAKSLNRDEVADLLTMYLRSKNGT